jgi:hypothetical protein
MVVQFALEMTLSILKEKSIILIKKYSYVIIGLLASIDPPLSGGARRFSVVINNYLEKKEWSIGEVFAVFRVAKIQRKRIGN